MPRGEFRFAYRARDFEATVDFYENGLGLERTGGWDRGRDDKGAIFSLASGLVEILSGGTDDAPHGAWLIVEVDDVAAWRERAEASRLEVVQEVQDEPWGHRDFVLRDPNGLEIQLFQPLDD